MYRMFFSCPPPPYSGPQTGPSLLWKSSKFGYCPSILRALIFQWGASLSTFSDHEGGQSWTLTLFWNWLLTGLHCRPVSNQFEEKNVRVQDWPPLCDWKKLECSDWPPLEKLKSLDWEGTGSVLRTFSIWGGQSEDLHWHSILRQFRGGPVEAILGGGPVWRNF